MAKLYVFGLLVLALLASSCARYDYYPRLRYEHQQSQANSKREAYIVRYGDTLYSIGRKFGIDFHRLAKINGIRRPYTIYVGQRIYLNGHHQPSRQTHTAKPSKPKPAATKPKPSKPKPTRQYPVANQGKVKLHWPVKGTVTSKFGPRRNRMHDGIDIGAKAGTPIYAAAAGKVVYADSRLSGYGNLIIIRHSSDMFTAYAHNKNNLVVVGQMVKAGQHIANVGATGRATGPHLHFEVRRGERAVDPLAYLPRK